MYISGPVRVDIWQGNDGKILTIFGDEHYSQKGKCFKGRTVIDILNKQIDMGGVVYIENLPLEYRKIYGINRFDNSSWLSNISNWAIERESLYPSQIVFVDIRYPPAVPMAVVENALENAEIKLEKNLVNDQVSNTVFMECFGDVGILLRDNYEYLKTKNLRKKCVFPFLENLSHDLKTQLLQKQTKFFDLISKNKTIHKNSFYFLCEEVYKAYSYYQDIYTLQKIQEHNAKQHFLCVGWGHLDTLQDFLVNSGFHLVTTLHPHNKKRKRCIKVPVKYVS